jgi:hypothetical protein
MRDREGEGILAGATGAIAPTTIFYTSLRRTLADAPIGTGVDNVDRNEVGQILAPDVQELGAGLRPVLGHRLVDGAAGQERVHHLRWSEPAKVFGVIVAVQLFDLAVHVPALAVDARSEQEDSAGGAHRHRRHGGGDNLLVRAGRSFVGFPVAAFRP